MKSLLTHSVARPPPSNRKPNPSFSPSPLKCHLLAVNFTRRGRMCSINGHLTITISSSVAPPTSDWTATSRVPGLSFINFLTFHVLPIRVAEVVRGHGGPPPRSLDSDENFNPEQTLFCRELRFVAITHFLGMFGQKKCLFGSKTVFLGQEVH